MSTPGPARSGIRRWPAWLPFVLLAATACGQKGPPLPPLRLVPAAMADVAGRRTGDEVRLQFKLPTSNLNGPGPIDLDHVEVFAVTVAPGHVTPANRDLLSKTYAVGTVAVKPPPPPAEPGAAKPEAAAPSTPPPPPPPPDPRPGPGDLAVYTETLGEAQRTPAPLPVAPAPAVAAAAAAAAAAIPDLPTLEGWPVPPPPVQPGDVGPPPVPAGPPVSQTAAEAVTPAAEPAATAAAATAAPATPGATPTAAAAPAAPPPPVTYPVRVYVIRGVSKAGRPGQPSARITVPLVDPPPAPAAPSGDFTEKAVVLTWAPVTVEAGGPPVAYSVYRGGADGALVTPAPVAEPHLEVPDFQVGREDCFVVRSVQTYQGVAVESPASTAACVTPVDRYPPSAPPRLSGFFLEGAIELVWDVSPEPDVAGYIVLRGVAPGDTLQPLTPEPVTGTTYRDTAVTAGMAYVYAVVAVDRAGNRSPASMRVEGTAR